MPTSDLASFPATIGYDVIQEEMPAVNFVKKYQGAFSLKYAALRLIPSCHFN